MTCFSTGRMKGQVRQTSRSRALPSSAGGGDSSPALKADSSSLAFIGLVALRQGRGDAVNQAFHRLPWCATALAILGERNCPMPAATTPSGRLTKSQCHEYEGVSTCKQRRSELRRPRFFWTDREGVLSAMRIHKSGGTNICPTYHGLLVSLPISVAGRPTLCDALKRDFGDSHGPSKRIALP